MSTERNLTTPVLAIAVVAALGAAAYLLTRPGPAPTAPEGGDPTEKANPASSWRELTPTHTFEVALTAHGPTFQDGPLTLAPTPRFPGAEPTPWKIERTDTYTRVTNTTTLRGRPLTQTWTFGRNDPQIDYEVTLEGARGDALATPITGSIGLPAGAGQLMGEDARLAPIAPSTTRGAWSAHWLQLGEGDQAWTLSAQGLDAVSVPQDLGVLTLTLWDPASHPELGACPNLKLTLRARMTLTRGARPAAIPSRIPAARLAALAPVFTSPRAHPDRALRKGAARDAADWLARARTLSYGHSSPQDPRFGNGGLQGTANLGATLVLPRTFEADPNVRTFTQKLENTRVDVARPGGPTSLREELTCEALLGDTSRTLLVPGEVTPPDALGSTPAHAPIDGLPLTVQLPLLDGSRSTLLRGVFASEALEALVEARGVQWFATPMVGTRNPLEPAAREALLTPERQGQWTLSKPMSIALGDLELFQESREVWFSPLSELMGYWRAARQVSARQQADGTWTVYNPGPPIPGFTLIMTGDVQASVGGKPVATRRHEAGQTWLSWELAEGPTQLVLDGEGRAQLAAVDWKVLEP